METVKLQYEPGSANAQTLQEEIDEVLAELSQLRVEVKEEQVGIEPVTMTILLGIGTNVASHVLIKVWEQAIWPRVRDRLDDDALGKRKDDED
jgi:hypothetical protein